MAKTKCEVRNGRMVACGDLSTDADTNFDGACQQLLTDPAKDPVADLTKVNTLSSTYVGLLAELALGMSKSGKKLKIVAGGVNRMRGPDFGALVITHYQRILNLLEPDVVHILYQGRIVSTGGKELVHQLEAQGYDWVKERFGAEEAVHV